MKYCVNCKWLDKIIMSLFLSTGDKDCKSPNQKVDIVTGKLQSKYAFYQRSHECGTEAKWFELK